MSISDVFPTDRLPVVIWNDPMSSNGLDPRDRYVEKYWLGFLGPSTTWLLRHLVDELEASPAGFVLDVHEAAKRLGVGSTGRHSPFVRSIGRLIHFGMARIDGGVLYVRVQVPALEPRHVARLGTRLKAQHDLWQRQQLQGAH